MPQGLLFNYYITPVTQKNLLNNESGSSNHSEPDFLAVGKLRRPHGVHGEILLTLWTQIPGIVKPGVEVYVGYDHKAVHINNVRRHKNDLIISFDEFQIREEVGLLSNQILQINKRSLPALDDDEYYLHQIIGMSVVNEEDDSILGTVSQILETGANDVYIVRTQDGKEIMIPAIEEVIRVIDIEKKTLWIRLLPGLLESSWMS